ncbi:MAG: hypothetical protein QW779_04700 [Nitrososphaerales archaeon]
MINLKKEFLELLEKDIEFRYAVAGYLGLLEILKRLDSLTEEQTKLREEMSKVWNEIVRLREEQSMIMKEQEKLREDMLTGFARYDERMEKLREDMVAGFKRHDEQIAKLREDMLTGFARYDERMEKLREDIHGIFHRFDLRLTRVERTLEKLTMDVEDEARSILKYRIKNELGLDVELSFLILPELELNIYGVTDELCVVGEATVRGGLSVLEDFMNKIEILKNKYPNKLRKRMIRVIYICLPMPELINEAKKKDIWILKATEDFYKPKFE